MQTRMVDIFWHRLYWAAVRCVGTEHETVTDLAERAIDAHLARRGAPASPEWSAQQLARLAELVFEQEPPACAEGGARL
jgi:hypothetical protein